MTKQFTLGKAERLKSRKLIDELFRDGKSFSVFPYRVYYLTADNIATGLQFGVGVSTRSFKKAVDRNRIKRLTREAYRLQKQSLKEKFSEKKTGLALFFNYTGKDLPTYEMISKKIAVILEKLMTITHEDPAAHT